MHSRMSEKYWRDLPKANASILFANELGFSNVSGDSVKVSEITDEKKTANFSARIVAAFEVKEFNRSDGTIGRVGNLMVGDETGKIRVTLWDNVADLLKTGEIKVGQTVQISGSVKYGYSGVEIHVGNNDVLTKSEEQIEVTERAQQIKDIKDGAGDLNLTGKVLEISDTRTFQRKDGTAGKVGNLQLGDSTGTIRVVLWDEKTDVLTGIKCGDSIDVINGYARENGFSHKVELQIGNQGIIRKSEKQIEYKEKFLPIADIVADMYDININGKVLDISVVKTFEKKNGSSGRVRNFLLGDATDKISVSLWDEKTDLEVNTGETVEVLHADSRENVFSQQVELNLGTRGAIRKSIKTVEYREKFTDIAEIIPGKSYSVQGKVLEVGELREFEREDGTESAVANLELKDETGRIRLTLWGDQAYQIESLDIGSEIQIINAYAKTGLNEENELSVGNRSRMVIL
jgi:replication factor A1